MVWHGVVLRRARPDTSWAYCVHWDRKRAQWELPKGGAELSTARCSTGRVDSTPFATARCELWEEAGVWLAWRPEGTYAWLTAQGRLLPNGPAEGRSAFVCTELRPEEDCVDVHPARSWMTLARFAGSTTREDHVRLVRRWEELSERPQKCRKVAASLTIIGAQQLAP